MKKKSIITIVAASAAAVLLIGGIGAYFTDGDTATNAFASDTQDTVITEEFPTPDPVPGGTFVKSVSVNVSGDVDSYVRMRIMCSDETVAKAPFTGSDSYLVPMSASGGDWLTADSKGDWIYDPSDEFYYFTGVVKSGESIAGPSRWLVRDNIPYDQLQTLKNDFDIFVYVESWQAEGYANYQECWAFADEKAASSVYKP